MSVIKYIFTLIGLGLLVGAFLWYSGTKEFIETAVSTEGTVIDLHRSRSSDSDTYAPVVEFRTSQGQIVEFTSSSSSNPPSYSVGESVEVLYDDSSPQHAKIKSFFSLWGGALIIGVIGAVFFLIGFSIIFFGAKRKKEIDFLKKNGTRIKADFKSVEYNSSLKVNGKSPYQIYSQWLNQDTSEVHIFKSDNLWFDPTDHIKQDTIDVLVDMKNLKKYYVDVSFLPKLAD